MPDKNKLENIYLKIIEWGTYLALFTPFIFIRDYFFPFVVPKTIFFRIVVDIVFIAYILLAVSNPKYRPRITPLTIAITLFLGVLVLTSIIGVNFERSFWSVFERMTGLLTFFHLFVFYIVLTSCFKERKYWERILSVSILACVLISFYALTSKDPITRGGGTLGNSSFFSSYLLFNIFFVLILLVVKSGLWRIFYGLALTLFLFLLFFNPGGFTKGAVSAFVIGTVILIFGSLMFYLFSSGKRKLKNIAFLLVILLVLGASGFFQLDFTKEKMAELWQSGNVQSRLILWDMAWQAWQERFWLGWGLENFNVPFAKYFDPKLTLTNNIWYDKAHNIVLDTGVSSGIIGLLSYLSIFGIAIFGLLKLLPKAGKKKNIIIPLGMVVLLLVYFFQDLFVFDMISSYMMFFLSLAFVSFLISPQREEDKSSSSATESRLRDEGGKESEALFDFAVAREDKEENRQKVVPLPSFIGVVLIVLTILTFFLGNIQPARASKFILKGIAYPLEQSLSNFQKAFKASSMAKFETPEQFSMKISALAVQTGQNKELLNQGFQLAEEEFKKSITQNPLDFRLYLFLGRHYNYFYQFTEDEEKLVLAEKVLEKALELSPTNQQVYFIFAQTRFLQGNKEKALEFLQKAKDLEPRFVWSGWYLARGYKITGKYELALSELKELENLGFDWQRDTENLKEGIEILKETGEDINVLIPLYEKGIELDSQDLYLWEDLINAYIDTDKREKAKETAENFLKIKPEFAPQVEQLLKELGY